MLSKIFQRQTRQRDVTSEAGTSNSGEIDPLVIVFNGSKDELIVELLKIYKERQAEKKPRCLRKLAEPWEYCLDKLMREKENYEKLKMEFEELQPEYIQAVKAEESCNVLQEQVEIVTEKNAKLEEQIVKMRQTISLKKTFMKLGNARRVSQQALVAKHNALIAEKAKIIKKHDKVCQDAFKYKVKQHEAEQIIEDNECLLENIRQFSELVGNERISNTVTRHIVDLKEKQVSLINDLKSVQANKQMKVDLKTEQKFQKMEAKAYDKCNKALEKEKVVLAKKHAKLMEAEFKLLKKRGFTAVKTNEHDNLRQQVAKMYGSLKRESLLQLSLTTTLNSLEVKEILDSMVTADTGTQTSLTMIEPRSVNVDDQTITETAPEAIIASEGVTENRSGTSEIDTAIDNERVSQNSENERPTVRKEFSKRLGHKYERTESDDKQTSTSAASNGLWDDDEYY